ncbi:MAG: hypothetical protein HUU35_06710, partial [Armatimonadetes bacterium]|nr:hypothetical protein [Armatimonadota bacterium]
MTPQTAQMAAVAVVAVFQLLSAMRVMRATAERPDLTGLSRFVPILLALFVPVIGPFIAGRATDAGIRPTLLSAVGLAAGFGLYAFLGAPTAP